MVSILLLVLLFLVLYHYQVFSQIVTAISNSVGGTITRLQKGV